MWSQERRSSSRNLRSPVVESSGTSNDQSLHQTQPSSRSTGIRTNQPAGGVSTISFGESFSLEEPDPTFHRRRSGSDYKRREMTGSGIFDYDPEPKLSATCLPVEKRLAPEIPMPETIPSFVEAEDSTLSPNHTLSPYEAAKQRELSGSYFDKGGVSVRRPCSSAKSKELEGSDIFGRSSQQTSTTISPKSFTNDLNNTIVEHEQQENAVPRTCVKVSNPAGGRSQISFGSDDGPDYGIQGTKNMHLNQKVVEVSGNKLFEKDSALHGYSTEHKNSSHSVSAAKRREMLGNDIFSTVDTPAPEIYSRISYKQPPGGRSNLKLL